MKKKNEDIKIGIRIKNIRANLELDQKTFANKIGCTVSALSNWENGRNKPNDIMVKKISDEGGITVNELVHGSPWEYARKKIDNICKEHTITDTYFYSIYYSYPPSFKEETKDENPKEAIINLFINNISESDSLSYSFIDSDEFDISFLKEIGYDTNKENASLKEKIFRYTNEIMDIEISQFQNQKYKLLYDPILKETILQKLLSRYDFKNLTDIGIKQYTKELLEKHLDIIQLFDNYTNPYSDDNAIKLTIEMLDTIIIRNINEYYQKENVKREDLNRPIKEVIKDELTYQSYVDITNAIGDARETLRDIQKNDV